MTITDVAYYLEERMRPPRLLDRDELSTIAETIFEAGRNDRRAAILGQSASEVTRVAAVGWHRSPALRILRIGLVWFFLLATIGIYFLLRNAGIGLALLFSAPLVLLVFAYGHGLRTGDYLVSPRYSILGMLVFVALIITSLVAGIEAFVLAR